ncbi:Sphingosine kinase 2 [Durusdinium trenchii]|uniref:Sphingosine kinase 2 n=1 Tax=Durusdinium trenchii TaxID=1381693 RepID=A0ABP0KKN4_9DINO
MEQPRVVELEVPGWGAVSVPKDALALAVLGVVSFVAFFLLDPFRIIDKVDLRLVRLYEAPKKSAVRGRKVLCIVNPFSGRKEGLWQYAKVGHPLLKAAGAQVELVQTTHAGHFAELGAAMASDFLQDAQKHPFPDGGVLIFGGDGSVNEFLNGAISEASGGTNSLDDPKVVDVLEALKFAHVPCGSANGIAASAGATTPYQVIVQAIEGDGTGHHTAALDLTQVILEANSTAEESRMVDSHCVSWGIISDHDELIEDKWRHLGMLKMVLAPIYCILRNPSYAGTILLDPVALDLDAEKHGYCDGAELPEAEELSKDPRYSGWQSIRRIEGDFIMVTLANLSDASYDVKIAPGLGWSDGEAALVVVKAGLSRLSLIRIFLAFEDGSYLKLPFVQAYKVRRAHILADKVGSFTTSGAMLEDTRSVRLETIQGAANYVKS